MHEENFNISFMQLSDIDECAQVLSVAMRDNPLHIAVLKGDGETQRKIIEKLFIDLLNERPGTTFIAKKDNIMVGVMRMKSCCGAKREAGLQSTKEDDSIEHRIALWHREWSLQDPVEQHWHLGPIGVLPPHRGIGIGTAFMNIFCREVDRCRAKAFLETDKNENVLFYEKFGFEVISRSNIFDVESRYMARAAKQHLGAV